MADKDILRPEFDAPSRKSTITIAGFNLTASIMGGGVLSIPYALSKTGIVFGTLLMVLAAIATERSMYLLCLCSRMTGAKTFGEVGEAAFGKNMEYFISCILCIFLCFAMIGYMVLAKDIWSSVIAQIFGVRLNEDFVLGIIIVLLVPLLVQKSLHALRFSCYVGVFSVSTLCLALVRHAMAVPVVWSNVLLWSTSFEDVLVAFPIISLSFLGIFNVLPIQNSLVTPCTSRMQLVLGGSIGSVFCISSVFGLAGYLYAGESTQGNILKNCETAGDFNLLLGKLGCGTMVVLAIPLMMVPCRSCLLEIVDVLVNGAHVTPVEERLPLKLSDTKESSYDAISSAPTDDDDSQESSQHTEGEEAQSASHHKVAILDNILIHYGATFFLFSSCYLVAVRVPGVAVVWSILGCSLGYLVAFILPSALYLKIQKRYRGPSFASRNKNGAWVWFSWILLVTSLVATVVCTSQAIKTL
mmetsp:Transcript_9340/g.23243  ORF Transcript_9340/g.23243 Transcript_9340/m.23243 type:complete len:470 (+) Transcript_9340:117-1526(+)